MSKDKAQSPSAIRNKKASFDYILGDKFEAGIILQGTEVKAVRAGGVQLNDAFVRIEKGKAILYHAHIDEYAFGNTQNHPTRRPRELLLHTREVRKLLHASQAEGFSIIPTRIYFKGSLVKVEIALAKGKKHYDKRESLKKKTQMREIQRDFRTGR